MEKPAVVKRVKVKMSKELPDGKPRRWPHSTKDERDALPDRIVDVGGTQRFWFRDNKVKTSKYEWYSFLPLFLLEEFNPVVKVANVYFLIIAALQCIPEISNTNGLPTFLIPLSIVVTINALFAGFEDLGRHRADREANFNNANVYNRQTQEFDNMHQQDVRVGDIIRVDNRDLVPADCVVVGVHEKTEPAQGICFVETKQLDGETNLKTKFALPGTMGLTSAHDVLSKFNGRVTMEHPNNLIDSFTGVIDLSASQITIPGFEDYADEMSITEKVENTDKFEERGNRSRSSSRMSGKSTKGSRSSGKHPFEPSPIQHENLLLRGCYLRNTQYVYALVLNTGHDTKIMMSSTHGRKKASTMETQASEEIKRIMLMLVLICFIGAIGQTIWNDQYDYRDLWYLEGVGEANKGTNFVVAFFYFFLLHASCIPVSLYVSLSMSRAGQTYFMNNDLDMYYPRLDAPGHVRTMNLNEDLGKVTHVFSDKTGTLTSNIMNFRKMSIGGRRYGRGITEIGKVSMRLQGKKIPEKTLDDEQRAKDVAVSNVAFYCPEFITDMEPTRDFKSKGARRLRLRTISNASTLSELTDGSGGRGGGLEGLFTDTDADHMDQVQLNQTFFKILALCHDTIAERLETGQIKLSASNPDDEALVAAAAYFGYKFADRADNICHIQNVESIAFEAEKYLKMHYDSFRTKSAKHNAKALPPGSALKEIEMTELPTYDLEMREEIQVLMMIKFTSKRKRMSVMIRDTDGNIKLLIKGADTAMVSRICDTPEQAALLSQTVEHVEQFSSEGLRCLLIGYKDVDDHVFEDWIVRYEEASADVKEIEKQKLGLPNSIETLEDEIEQGISLIGASALEDKLQDGVPECIADLVKAGLVIWMLTGDKEETAINIAIACNLLAPEEYMDHIIVNGKKAATRRDMHRLLAFELAQAQNSVGLSGTEDKLKGRPRALVIDGPSLSLVLEEGNWAPDDDENQSNISANSSAEFVPLIDRSLDEGVQGKAITAVVDNSASSEEEDAPEGIPRSGTRSPRGAGRKGSDKGEDSSSCSSSCSKCLQSASVADCTDFNDMTTKQLLLELTQYCKAVVACRVSPDQKREMVDLIKGSAPDRESILTLAIGDGANDVPMIQGAHIGVGIRGEEGQQAVNNADYAIAQFEYLRSLLLKHGRYNYIRMSNCICYIFYKNILASTTMFWFNLFCGWSGQKFFAEGPIQAYNLLFTSLPILLYAIYDRDMDYDKVRAFPRIYASRDNGNSNFNTPIFWSWCVTALAEAVVICVLSVYLLEGYSSPRLGYHATFWSSGALAYSVVVTIVNLRMFTFQSSWGSVGFLILFLSLLVWVVFAYGLNISKVYSLPSFYEWYYVYNHLLSAPQFYVSLVFITVLGIIGIVFVQGLGRMSFYSNRHILQEMSKFGIDPFADTTTKMNIEAHESSHRDRGESTVTHAVPVAKEEISAAEPVDMAA